MLSNKGSEFLPAATPKITKTKPHLELASYNSIQTRNKSELILDFVVFTWENKVMNGGTGGFPLTQFLWPKKNSHKLL